MHVTMTLCVCVCVCVCVCARVCARLVGVVYCVSEALHRQLFSLVFRLGPALSCPLAIPK